MTDPNDPKGHFDSHASDWMRRAYEGGGHLYPTALVRARRVCDVIDELGGSLRVADIGCGGGALAVMLAERGHIVHAFDQSPTMIDIARDKATVLHPEAEKRLAFKVLDIECEPLPVAGLDVVTSLGVIGYLSNDDVLFSAARSALRPGGRFVVSCRNRLFNMNSLSFRTLREIDAGTGQELIEEIREHYRPLSADDVAMLVDAFETLPSRLEEWRRSADDAELLTEAADSGEKVRNAKFEARQQTPKGLRETAARHGLEEERVFGIHPHLLDPNLNGLMPAGLFDLISACLEPLADHPASVTWSSVFVSVFVRSESP